MLVSIRNLCVTLGIRREKLRSVAARAAAYYDRFDSRPGPHCRWRHIDNPREQLKFIQKRILQKLLVKTPLPLTLRGGSPGSRLADHASPHRGQQLVVTTDIYKCFPSITHQMVFRALTGKVGLSPGLARQITKLTTLHGSLPQGAPTSPYLALLVMAPMHEALVHIAGSYGCRLTQWVDDIVISGLRAREALRVILREIRRHGLTTRASKTIVSSQSSAMIVTGISINRRLSAGSRRIRAIKRRARRIKRRLFVYEGELESILGQAQWVASVNPKQGDDLGRWLGARLGSHRETRPRVQVPDQRRKCACSKDAARLRLEKTKKLRPATSPVQLSFFGMGRYGLAVRRIRIRQGRGIKSPSATMDARPVK